MPCAPRKTSPKPHREIGWLTSSKPTTCSTPSSSRKVPKTLDLTEKAALDAKMVYLLRASRTYTGNGNLHLKTLLKKHAPLGQWEGTPYKKWWRQFLQLNDGEARARLFALDVEATWEGDDGEESYGGKRSILRKEFFGKKKEIEFLRDEYERTGTLSVPSLGSGLVPGDSNEVTMVE